MIVEYHPLFSEDLFRAAEYLEDQEEGLGRRLIDTVEDACRKVHANPEHYRFIEKPVRRILAEPFAYAIHYELHDDRLFFYGVVSLCNESDALADAIRGRERVRRFFLTADFADGREFFMK